MEILIRPCLDLLTGTGRPSQALETLLEVPEGSLIDFLHRHRLGPLLLRAIEEQGLLERLPDSLREALATLRRREAVAVMRRTEAASALGRALNESEVDFLFFKGFHLGEALYGDATLRPSADLDVLVSQKQRTAALAAAKTAGFDPNPQALEPDYQVALFGHDTPVDLHWHVLQPQRSRVDLEPFLFANRSEIPEGFAPSPEAALLILLLNPSVTDYVSGRLIQVLDLERLLTLHPELDWDTVVHQLRCAGLRTAAWTLLEHARQHLELPLPPRVENALRPGPLRRAWLRAWLRRDPARLYTRHPLLTRAGFGLALQDAPRDVLRMVRWFIQRDGRSKSPVEP